MATSDTDLNAAFEAYQKHYGDGDAAKQMSYDDMVNHAQKMILAQAAQTPAAPPTSAQDALATARAAYERGKDIGLTVEPPSAATIAAAQAEMQSNAAAAADKAHAQQLATQSNMPNVAPASGTANLPDARALTDEDVNPNGQLTPSGMLKLDIGGSGPAQGAVDAASADYAKASQGVDREQAALRDSLSDQQVAAAQSNEAAETELKTNMARNAELLPLWEKKEKLADDYAMAVKQSFQAATEATNQQMARIRQTSDEAATAQIKDFWADKSVAGKIMGVISQAFAGAANGLSGQPGAPTPLDHIINRDLEVQRIALNEKTGTAYREQGILGLMQRHYDSQQAAMGAAQLSAISHVDALEKEVSQKYNTPQAIALYQQVHAQNLQKYAQTSAQIHGILMSSNLQQKNTAAGILERATSANAAYQSALGKQGGKTDLHILGVNGPVNPAEYHQLAEHAQATTVALNAYGKIDELLKHPDFHNKNWVHEFNLAASDTYAVRRIQQKTGARLEGKEAALVEVGVPQLKEAALNAITPSQVYDMRKEIEHTMQYGVEGYTARLRAFGRQPDLNDPTIGSYIRRMAKPAGS